MNKKYFLLFLTGLIVVGIAAFFTINVVQADTVEELYKEAQAAYKEEDYEKSVDLYQDVLAKDTAHEKARLEMAKSYMALSDYESAIRTLNDGIYEVPERSSNYLLLSDVHLAQLNVEKAYGTLNKGAEHSGDSTIEEARQQLESNIYIDIPRQLVQQGYDREIALIWEDKNGEKHPLEGEWNIEDSSIGTLEPVKSKVNTMKFTAYKLGTTSIDVSWNGYEETTELKVDKQVLDEVSLQPDDFSSMQPGDTMEMTISGKDEAGEAMDFKPIWSSSNNLVDVEEIEEHTIKITAREEGEDLLTILYLDYKQNFPLTIGDEEEKGEEEEAFQTETVGNGTITVYPDKETYEPGEAITLEAFPEEGWEFVGWGGDVEEKENPLNLTAEDSMKVLAYFQQTENRLSLSITGEGNIIRDSLNSTYPEGEEVSLRARPEPGWSFVRWEGDHNGSDSDILLTMDGDKSVVAVFEEDGSSDVEEEDSDPQESVTFSLNTSVNGQGNVTKSKSGSNLEEGTKVRLIATPANGWTFTGWSGSASGSRSDITMTMNGNKSIQANFKKKATPTPEPTPEPKPAPDPEPEPAPEPQSFTLSTSVNGEGSVQASSRKAKAGQTISVEAVPAEGWTFTGWSGDLQGNSASSSITMNGNKQVTANFEKISE
ncbi:UNVERIFIED_CONTAM: InlB B-repeat-containing protein [Halobacillus marinus]